MQGGEVFVAAIAIIFSHSLVFGVFYFIFRQRHRERMTMIERGVDPSIFLRKPSTYASSALKYGLFLTGLALGIFAGSLLDHFTQIDEGAAYISMIFLFGGLGLLAFYIIERKNAKRSGE
jgi:preprotein translocase subunit YajC